VIDERLGLRIVDALTLSEAHRHALRPGELLADPEGRPRRLPRFFFEVESRDRARQVIMSPHFTLNEFLEVDVREAAVLCEYPRYIPIAVQVLVIPLQLLRDRVGTAIHIAVNGGYRSPAHLLSGHATPHGWGSAANIYRIGDELLDTKEKIEKFGALASQLIPGVWVRPFGSSSGQAMDHLHFDMGFVTVVPRDAPGETIEEGRSSA
jgi:hypothetical protein